MRRQGYLDRSRSAGCGRFRGRAVGALRNKHAASSYAIRDSRDLDDATGQLKAWSTTTPKTFA